jgi:NAD(P)-dependent dehydrogenase (short-subunit alcohol dehydrogenase family)
MAQSEMRTALVTGASRGIRRAIALRLVQDGFAVVVNYAGSASGSKGWFPSSRTSCAGARSR